MMRYSFLLAGLLMLGMPVAGHAQQQGQQTDVIISPADTAVVELVLRREVFTYPTFARRNPFVPLTSADAGPRFDQMRLTGIAFDDLDPSASIAIIAADGGVGRANPTAQPPAGQQASRGLVNRLRAGERWGNVRIVAVERDRVVVDVNNFGIVERREMRLQSRSQGGS